MKALNALTHKTTVLPAVMFFTAAIIAYGLFNALTHNEDAFVRDIIAERAERIKLLINAQAYDRLVAIKHMAHRWNAAGGTPKNLWQQDAADFVATLKGLKTLEWVDSTYHVRWIEPLAGNEKAVGLDILFDTERKDALKGAAGSNSVTLTPPLDLVQGYTGFIAYVPVQAGGKPDGFMAAVFSIDAFFDGTINSRLAQDFRVALWYDGREYYHNAAPEGVLNSAYAQKKDVPIYNKDWKLVITPTREFLQSQLSSAPEVVLASGLLIGLLLSLMLHAALITRRYSRQEAELNKLNNAIMSSATFLVVATDLDGRVVRFNEAAENALGYSAHEVLCKHTPALWHDKAQVARRAAELTQELGKPFEPGFGVFTAKPNLQGKESSEWTFIRKDGSGFLGNLVVTPMRDASGVITGYVGIIEDITERRKVERLKSEFISVVSHELRTPLTSIRGSLGLMRAGIVGEISPKAKDMTEIAYNNAERLILLINDILDMDKIESGEMRFDIKEYDLGNLLSQAVEANQAYGEKFGVRFVIDPFAPPALVGVDMNRFIQVLSNLLSNAAKFSRSGDEVRLSVTRQDGRIRIAVIDKGPGIPEEFHARIFGKFAQADSSSSRQQGGTGLGLNISKKIIEHMKGEIGFASKVNEGTVFWVMLPEIERRLSGELQHAVDYFNADDRNFLPRVLHAEDDLGLCHIVSEALKGKAVMHVAATVGEASRLLKSHAYDLAILDLALPDGAGLKLLEQIENDKQPTRVVILSASEVDDAVRARVSLALVKSKITEAKAIEHILTLISKDTRFATERN